MMKWIIVPVLLFFVFLGVSVYAADDLAQKMQKADQLLQVGEPATINQAGDIYLDLLAKYPTNYDLLWKTAKYYDKLGLITKNPLPIFEKGKDLAEKATKLYPNRVEGHYWLASLIGRVGEEKGILNSLFMVKPMKAELDRCLEIDPKFPDTYYVLGLLYWKVPGWPVSIGDKKKAVECAQKAVDLKPTDFSFQYGLYEALHAANRDAEAKAVLERIIKMPITPGNEKDGNDYKKKAQEALKNAA